MSSVKAKFGSIKAVILDVDGVLTDGSIVVTTTGEEHRIMNTKDGYALNHAARQGFPVWVISGGLSEGVGVRLRRLGLTEVHLGVKNKFELLEKLMQQHGFRANELLYMGDDLPDFACMQMCGISACPQDAAPEIRELADYVVPVDGGKGCVRHLLREVLLMQNKWGQGDAISA